MSDGGDNNNNDNNTEEPKGTSGTYTTAPEKKQETKKGNKKKDDTVAKVSKEELARHIKRKQWTERIAMALLVSALIVYFIVLIFSMIASSNSSVVEKDTVEKMMATPAVYIEVISDSETLPLSCTFELYTNDSKKISGTFSGNPKTHFNSETVSEGWTLMNLTQYNYTGIIINPPDGDELKVERGIKNHIDMECNTGNYSIFINFYYPGQYAQYEDDEQDLIDAIAYDALDSKMGFETDYDLTWFTISDDLQFASKPEDLDGIDGAFDYYEMSLSGVYPLSGPSKEETCKTGFSFYRKHTDFMYVDSTTFADVVAAIGGMYTSLASVVAFFVIKFLWGYEFKIYTWQVYKWTGYAPHAPKDKKEEGEEGEEEDGADV